MSGRLGNATDNAIASTIKPLNAAARPRPKTQKNTFNPQCMVFFCGRGVGLDGSVEGGVRGIEEGGFAPSHYKNACKVQAQVDRYLVMGAAWHLSNVQFLGRNRVASSAFDNAWREVRTKKPLPDNGLADSIQVNS